MLKLLRYCGINLRSLSTGPTSQFLNRMHKISGSEPLSSPAPVGFRTVGGGGGGTPIPDLTGMLGVTFRG